MSQTDVTVYVGRIKNHTCSKVITISLWILFCSIKPLHLWDNHTAPSGIIGFNTALGPYYAALGPRTNVLRPLGCIIGPLGCIKPIIPSGEVWLSLITASTEQTENMRERLRVTCSLTPARPREISATISDQFGPKQIELDFASA